MLFKAVKSGSLSAHRRMQVAKCSYFLSFCCLGSVVLCLFDSNLPGMDCLDGSGTWVTAWIALSRIGGWCMVNDTLDRIG
jgi:hypothetical protein